jgi:hypothetical protein
MARFQHACLVATALIGVGAAGAPAFATTINVDNVQLPYSESVNLSGWIDGSSYSDNGQLAGQILLTVNEVGSASQYTLPVWCVDIFHDIALGGSGYQYTEGALDTDHSNNPSPLSSPQVNAIKALALYGNALMLSNPSNRTSAEIQAAIWTVEYNNASINNTLTVSGGDFTSTDIANLIVSAQAASGSVGQLIALNGGQAEVFDPVPEPASFGLLGAGLLGLAFARPRKG